MKVNWKPTKELIAKMKRINDLKKSGKTYEEITKIIKLHYTMIVTYNKYYEAHFNKTS